MNTLTMPLARRSAHNLVRSQQCVPRLLSSLDHAEVTQSPLVPLPVPENPVPSPPEFPDPHGPVGEPLPMENPIPVREPPTTLPPRS